MQEYFTSVSALLLLLVCIAQSFLAPTAARSARRLTAYEDDSTFFASLADADIFTTASAPSAPLNAINVYVLAHGFVGGANDLTYLRSAILREANSPSSPATTMTFAACAGCNEGRTFDGVRKGGERLASLTKEIIITILSQEGLISQRLPAVHLTLVGNSLGGLYCRYAASLLFSAPTLTLTVDDQPVSVFPSAFVTTASPWLGIASNTYLPIPRFAEKAVGLALSTTGKDLCSMTGLVYEMATGERFLAPLSHFSRRIAVSNTFNTDFLVSQTTGAFLDKANDTPHIPKPVSSFSKTDMISESFETKQTYTGKEAVPPASTSVEEDNAIGERVKEKQEALDILARQRH